MTPQEKLKEIKQDVSIYMEMASIHREEWDWLIARVEQLEDVLGKLHQTANFLVYGHSDHLKNCLACEAINTGPKPDGK